MTDGTREARLRLADRDERVFDTGMERCYELEVLARSMAAMPPGPLALRREQAIDLLEELTELRGRHEALREALRRLADDEP